MKQFENLTPPEIDFIPFTRNFELVKNANNLTYYLSGSIDFTGHHKKYVNIDLYEVETKGESYLKLSTPSDKQVAFFQDMIDQIGMEDDSNYFKEV